MVLGDDAAEDAGGAQRCSLTVRVRSRRSRGGSRRPAAVEEREPG
jgi:hypothetical protein